MNNANYELGSQKTTAREYVHPTGGCDRQDTYPTDF
jgi:hypothetical protein